MSINKEKVSEILSDMKEEDRQRQEAIQKEVNEFLEHNLEYYVAMVLNGKFVYQSYLMMTLAMNNNCWHFLEVLKAIEDNLKTYDYFLCKRTRLSSESEYMHVSKIPNGSEIPDDAKKRQIELGLRRDEDNNGIVYYIAISVITAITLLMITCHH